MVGPTYQICKRDYVEITPKILNAKVGVRRVNRSICYCFRLFLEFSAD